MLEKDRRWLVYQGSIYSQHKRIPNEFWVMQEDAWEYRTRNGQTGNAVVLQRGLTNEVAVQMANLAKGT